MQNQNILCDAHVHIYPQFDVNSAIHHSIINFTQIRNKLQLPENTILVWLLTEGQKYDFFSQTHSLSNFRIERNNDKESLSVIDTATGQTLLYILAGRQIVTRDKLEVCALGTSSTITDRELGTLDTILWVLDHNGVPALNWAPGKWFFARGKIVRAVIESASHASLLISETTMRPTFWPTPSLMKTAMHKGFKVIAGSDPLPLPGEEKLVGSYASVLTGPFDPDWPAKSVKNILFNSGTEIKFAGKRSGAVAFVKRQYGIMSYNKKNKA